MYKTQYKQAMDAVTPRSGFEEETIAFLRNAVRPQNKEEKPMISKRTKIIVALIAAAFLMTTTVFAAVRLLRPDEVADDVGETAIAEAFRSDDAIIIDQTQQSAGYTFTLMGIVSGEGLENADGSRSYAVVAVANADGTPFLSDDGCPVTITPLVDGYEPWRLSVYTLDASCIGTTVDGVRYCLIATDSLEIFADHRVSIAVFEGIAPTQDVFAMDEQGVIGYSDSYTGAKAMFELPLDASKADPAAAAELLARREAEAGGEYTETVFDDEIQRLIDEYAAQLDGDVHSYIVEFNERDGYVLHVYDGEGNEIITDRLEGKIDAE